MANRSLTTDTILDTDTIVDDVNIADRLTEEELFQIGTSCIIGFDSDSLSRADWDKRYVNALKIAAQVQESKSDPWPNAANVKFPLLSIASLQFHARAYPFLVPSRGLVECVIAGYDPTGMRALRAERIQRHMNYQIKYQMPYWEEDMDSLLTVLPITGCEFKKIYYDPIEDTNESEFIRASDVVVDYYTKNFDKAQRVSQKLTLSYNDLYEFEVAGLFHGLKFEAPISPDKNQIGYVSDKIQGKTEAVEVDYNTPRLVIEQHTYWDFDKDGYAEPYIITIDYATKQVLRIVARYTKERIFKRTGAVLKIVPVQYFKKFDFIPSVDGGVYGMGFGTLVGPLNDSVNTLINQLLDAGTLSNLQSGFISKSFRHRGGSLSFKPGEWKPVNLTGADLKQGIMPLPVREPSNVLFMLLGTLIEAGQRLTSVTDIMVGENPGQNQKATTTQAVVENGMKVFTAIYKRIRRSLEKEFKALAELNKIYFDVNVYAKILGFSEIPDFDPSIIERDYEDIGLIVCPTADPNAVTHAQKREVVGALMQTLPVLGWNTEALKLRFIDAFEISNPEDLLQPSQQGMDPKIMLEADELQHNKQMDVAGLQLKAVEAERKQEELELKKAQLTEKSRADLRKDNVALVTHSMTTAQKQESDKIKVKKQNAEKADK